MNKKYLPIVVIAALALSVVFLATLSSAPDSQRGRMLSEENDIEAETEQEFNKFVAKYRKSYLTKEEYTARLGAFKANYVLV